MDKRGSIVYEVNKMELSDYVQLKREEFKTLELKLRLLESINLPLKIEHSKEGFRLYSEDYSLATDFDIKKRSKYIDGFSSYDGGSYSERNELYPQFYFELKREPKDLRVLIQHEGFEKDKRIVVQGCTVTYGSKLYSDESGASSHYIDIKKVFSFFEEKGVKEPLIDKLREKIDEINSLSVI